MPSAAENARRDNIREAARWRNNLVNLLDHRSATPGNYGGPSPLTHERIEDLVAAVEAVGWDEAAIQDRITAYRDTYFAVLNEGTHAP